MGEKNRDAADSGKSAKDYTVKGYRNINADSTKALKIPV